MKKILVILVLLSSLFLTGCMEKSPTLPSGDVISTSLGTLEYMKEKYDYIELDDKMYGKTVLLEKDDDFLVILYCKGKYSYHRAKQYYDEKYSDRSFFTRDYELYYGTANAFIDSGLPTT